MHIIGIALGLWGGLAHAGTAEFMVRPFLTVGEGNVLRLAWRYREPPEWAAAHVQLFDRGVPFAKLPVEQDGMLSFARFPAFFCTEGRNVEYELEGLESRQRLSVLPCKTSPMVKFSFIADTQQRPEVARRIAEKLAATSSGMILHGGDMVQTGNLYTDWMDFFAAIEPFAKERAMVPAIGNHEYHGDAQAPHWRHFFGMEPEDAYFSVWIGPVHLIVFNSCFENDKALPDRQLEWMEEELRKPAPWKVVMMHHPPFSSAFSTASLNTWRRKESLVLRTRFVPLFEKYKADLVLSGHTHVYERSIKDFVQYLVAGPAGGTFGMLWRGNPYSVFRARERTLTHFTATLKSLAVVTETDDGAVIDEFSLAK